jgi:hypothetical protein
MAESPDKQSSRTRRDAAALSAAIVIALCLLALFTSYLTHKEKPVVGTPAPRALFNASLFTLRPHARACMSSTTLPPNGRVLQLELGELPNSSHGNPPLDVLLSAPGYRALVHVPGEQSEGPVEVPVRPPRRYVIGSVCVVNGGTESAALAGSTEPRSIARSRLTINGKRREGDIALTFLNDRSQSRLSRLGEVFGHASNLTDRLIPEWLIWTLAVSALLVVPIGTVGLFRRAWREDVLAQYGGES